MYNKTPSQSKADYRKHTGDSHRAALAVDNASSGQLTPDMATTDLH